MREIISAAFHLVTFGFLDFDTSFTEDLLRTHQADLERGLELIQLFNPEPVAPVADQQPPVALLSFQDLNAEILRLNTVTVFSSDDQSKLFKLFEDSFRLHLIEYNDMN